MIECRNCRSYFRGAPEKMGARCPKCRAPLFERPDRQLAESGLGACAIHPGVDAVASCARCQKALCTACRTRWHGETLCTGCVELSLSRAEPNPRELRKQGGRAVWSFTLALIGWIIALCAVAMVALRGPQTTLTAPLVFSMLSVLPALIAVGQGCPVLLARGPRFRIAASGIIMAGTQLGLLLGVILINVWQN